MWDDSGNPLLTVARRNKAWVIPKTSSSSLPSHLKTQSVTRFCPKSENEDHLLFPSLGAIQKFALLSGSSSYSPHSDHIQVSSRPADGIGVSLPNHLSSSHRSLSGSAPDELQTFSIYKVWHYVLFPFKIQSLKCLILVSHLQRSIIGRKFALDQTRSARSTETRSTRWRDTNKRGSNTSTFALEEHKMDSGSIGLYIGTRSGGFWQWWNAHTGTGVLTKMLFTF